ncbi:ATP synthase [Klebsormidium nitens]|uniref:ATP synthase n=1 Tax=Klebsormidium nitens TaxID=105231 RepID=A0A1Y1HJM8_KLENI|nr:ATP synthase [Klebsormidium nitens]|eukprot:GAQ78740.1 ATP synthase [Klebsormidium nitens]
MASDMFACYLGSSLPGAAAFRQSRRPARGVVVMGVPEQVAKGYAQALMELAQSKSCLEPIHADMEKLEALIENQDVVNFLYDPVADIGKKQKLLATLGNDGGFNKYTINFLNLLIEKKRINTIAYVIKAFDDLYNDKTQTQVATVVSAVKLENAQQALIAKKLQTLTGAKNIKLKNEVDPELIAGFVLKYGKGQSEEIDFSVRGQLEKLRMEFESGLGAAAEEAEEKVAA